MKKLILLILFCVFCSSITNAALSDGLYKVMQFEETTGAVVEEISGDNGTNNNAARGWAGINNNSFYYDGTVNKYVTLSSLFFPNINEEFTVSFWYYANESDTTYKFFLDFSDQYKTWVFINPSNDEDPDELEWFLGTTEHASVKIKSETPITFAQWNMATLRNNGTDFILSHNGVNNASTQSGTFLTQAATSHIGTDDSHSLYGVMFVDELYIWNRSLTAAEVSDLYNSGSGYFYPFASENIPYVVNNSVNFTSDGGQICGYNGSEYIDCGPTNDTTGTFSFTTDTSATCKIDISQVNYTDSSSSDCSTTGTTSHVCTLSPALGLNQTTHTIYASCTAGGIDNNDWDYANKWNITLDFTPSGTVNVSGGFVTQTLAIKSYTGLTENRSLTITGYNPSSSSYTVECDPDSDYSVSNITLTISANSSASKTVYKEFNRGAADGSLVNISGAICTGDIVQVTNVIQTYTPIDPPSAPAKDGIKNCSDGYNFDTDLDIPFNLQFVETGIVYLNSILNVTGISSIELGCEFWINDSGRLNVG